MLKNIIHKLLNFILYKNPKKIVFVAWPNTESGAISCANYIVENYKHKVFFLINPTEDNPQNLLNPNVKIIYKKSKFDLSVIYHLYSSKFIFFTHGVGYFSFSKSQVLVNLWHGLFYKNIGKLLGAEGFPATNTVGTSELSQKMFSDAFGVTEESVIITGYPRNDKLFLGVEKQKLILEKLNLSHFDRVVLWMPTYRKSVVGDIRIDGEEVDNPFYIKDFNTNEFNNILKKNNAVCLVKPHPMAPKFDAKNLPNLKIIDNHWLYENNLDLYEFVGATDILISDVSSIMIDYMLINKPIICISEDFEEYKNSRGFYFEDIEDKIPTKVIKDKNEFLIFINTLLEKNQDPYESKRIELKKIFFKFHDNLSTERLIKTILKSVVCVESFQISILDLLAS